MRVRHDHARVSGLPHGALAGLQGSPDLISTVMDAVLNDMYGGMAEPDPGGQLPSGTREFG